MRWRRYFRRNARDTDLSQEIAHYIAQETDDNMARGMSAEEARVAAIRKFGNRRAIREAVYERNSIGWLEVVVQDLRYGLRQLRRRPGFAVAAIASLALGIGANTAIFTLVDQILLRLLPVRNPQELVQLRARRRAGPAATGATACTRFRIRPTWRFGIRTRSSRG